MKIGFLLPRSVLYPSIAFDMLDGLKAGLKTQGISDAQIVSANIGLGAKNDEIYNRCEQLLIDGADIILAYINPLSAEFIHPLFQNSGSLLLVLDSGYHFPSDLNKLSHAIYLSLQGNLCCRSIARAAVEEGHTRFAYTCSFYDAGYRSGFSFVNSLADRGGSIVYNHVTPLKKADFSLAPLSDFLKSRQADAVIASFCGDMTEDFLREGLKLDIFRSHPVFGSPFMGEETWLGKIPYPGNDWVCAVPWSTGLDNPENRHFVDTMEQIRPGKANVFSLLAWEASLLVGMAEKSGLPPEKALGVLEGAVLQTPRGSVYVHADTHIAEAPVYHATVIAGEAGHCRHGAVHEAAHTAEEREKLYGEIATLNAPANAWLNAYACLDS